MTSGRSQLLTGEVLLHVGQARRSAGRVPVYFRQWKSTALLTEGVDLVEGK